MKTVKDIRKEFIRKYINKDFRTIGNNVQQPNTVEIQNAHFLADDDWIIRAPNYNYAQQELSWYQSMSLNVNDIPGEKVPDMWLRCADKHGNINSNYGWAIFSEDNCFQYESCRKKLNEDPHTREAIMIYNRPSMQRDYKRFGMHDFMCCQNVQYFINDVYEDRYLDCIVNFRSNDAVFGYCNDYIWAKWVLEKLAKDLSVDFGIQVKPRHIFWNAGSLHIYERHFKFIDKLIAAEKLEDKDTLVLTAGCVADSFTINDKDFDDIPTDKQRDLLHKAIDNIVDDNQLYRMLLGVVESNGDMTSSEEPCELCGEYVFTYKLDL